MGMWKKGLALGLLATVAFAAPAFESTYSGKDSRKNPCKLQVVKTYYKGNTGKWEDFRAEVTSDFGHDSESAGEFLLSPHPMSTKDLQAQSADKSTIVVTLKEVKNFETVEKYTLVWKHRGHNHNFLCQNMSKDK